MKSPSPLPLAYKKIYNEFYLDYAKSKNIFRKMSELLEQWYHKKIARFCKKNQTILEVGAGSLNHLKYEQNTYKSYDIIEPKLYLVDESNPKDKRLIRSVYSNFYQMPSNIQYDYIISIATLEHVWNLKSLLSDINSHLSDHGKFLVAIPAEGEILWWLAWRLTTGIGFWLKYKLDYGVIMRYEHVNTSKEIIEHLSEKFIIKRIDSFPFRWENMRLFLFLELEPRLRSATLKQ